MKIVLAGRAGPPGPPRVGDSVGQAQKQSGGPSGPALPGRKHLPHGVPDWVEDGAVYFITICCAERGANQLCIPVVAEHIFEAVRFRQDRRDWQVHLFVLMPDHLHALISFGREKPMKTVIANFEEVVAKKTAVRWQRDFFDHRLRSDESYDEKAAYVRMNPVRKGLVAQAENWVYVYPMSNLENPAVPAVPPYLGIGPTGSPYL